MVYFWGLFLLESLVTFTMFGIDKKRAIKHQWRIPEKVLLTLAFFSGGIGSILGQRFFHHKTRKWYFQGMNLLGFLALVIICFINYS